MRPLTEGERARRNNEPIPEAVFAMWHWHAEYAAQNGGSMDFFDSLTTRQRRYCVDAVARISRAIDAERSTTSKRSRR